MKNLSKVVWAEGIFLGQQHFQAWEEYLEGYQHQQARRLQPLAWGILSLAVEEKALANGRFQLRECSAVFPDGRMVAFDSGEERPLMCELGGRGGETVEIYLALPANQDVEGISGYPRKGRLCAWRADYRQLSDRYDSQREREVLLARSNLFLLTGEDNREPFYSFKIAEVVGEGDGSFRLREEFIPPVARTGASPRLRQLLGRMTEMVGGRLRHLQERSRQIAGGPAEFAQREITTLLLLQALNGAWPRLNHFLQHPDLTPEALYLLCTQILGELCTFSPEVEVSRLPVYRHDRLGEVFAELEQLLGVLLNISAPTRSSALRLVRETDALLSAGGLDGQQLRSNTFFLEVFFEADDPGWITDFARQVKVCSRGAIEMVVATALPGVRLLHTQRPPAQLAVKSGHEYFRLEPRGDFWNRIVEEGTLAVFLPGGFARASVELVTVQE